MFMFLIGFNEGFHWIYSDSAGIVPHMLVLKIYARSIWDNNDE